MKLQNNKMRLIAAIVAAVGVVSLASTAAAAGVAWTYTGSTGPSHWNHLDPVNYAVCADGTAQSPINVRNPIEKALTNLKFNYGTSEAGIFNNGHTVEAEPLGSPTETLTIGKTVYPFLQFHFHAPSEHELNGLHFPLEIHFVHKTEDNKIAVVGVFVKAGKTNKDWSPFTAKITSATDVAEDTAVELDWAKLLPKNPQTIRYDGSLTTPGCTEGVKWNLFTHPITMSRAQISKFLEAYSGNNRPVQPLHGRKILIDSTISK